MYSKGASVVVLVVLVDGDRVLVGAFVVVTGKRMKEHFIELPAIIQSYLNYLNYWKGKANNGKNNGRTTCRSKGRGLCGCGGGRQFHLCKELESGKIG